MLTILLEIKLRQLHTNFPLVLRYRDYFQVTPDPQDKFNGYTVERIEQTLSEISGMELTVGSGRSLDFLECTLSLPDGTPSVPVKRPVFHGYARMSSPPFEAGLLDVLSPNTPRMLLSRCAGPCACGRPNSYVLLTAHGLQWFDNVGTPPKQGKPLCVGGCPVTNGVNDGVFHRCSQLCSPRSHPSLHKNA